MRYVVPGYFIVSLAVILWAAWPHLSALEGPAVYSLEAGTVRVVDGDTLALRYPSGERRIRLFGIDAPELEQPCAFANGAAYPCGEAARDFLTRLLRGARVVCRQSDTDKYGREVAVCWGQYDTYGRFDIAAAMVQAGWALDWPRYSRGAYAVQQESAKANKSGIWRGAFELPWEWRWAHQ
jgi:endonuclease YncB( thermonuclease family)